MSWLSNLFSKKQTEKLSPEELTQSKRKWEGFDYYSKGHDSFLNRQTSEALTFFDKALQYGFEENFSKESSKLFDLRALCLQGLDYHYDAINDFDKSIFFTPDDCNKYFSRSVSKGAILDYAGEVADLENAIILSKVDNALNIEYNDEARIQGYKNGVAEMYEMRLMMAKMSLDSDLKSRELIEQSKNLNQKETLQTMYDEGRVKRLKRIKSRRL